MIIELNQEGNLFNKSDVGAPQSIDNGEREERAIHVPNAFERAELEKEINKLTLDDMAEQFAPYLAFAKKYKLYKVDSNGKKVYPLEITKVFASDKILKKDWVTFYAVLSHPSNLCLFLNELSEKGNALLQHISANHCIFVEDAEKMMGKKLIYERRNRNNWRREMVPLPEYGMFLQTGRAAGPSSRYVTKQYYFELRKSIRLGFLQTVFRNYLKMETCEELPQEDTLKTYSGEASIFMNFPILISLFESKQIELGKSKVSAATIKNVQKACNIEEFFPNGEKEAARLCAHLIANTYTLFAAVKGTQKEQKTENNIKDFVLDMFGYIYYMMPTMLFHIKGFRRNFIIYNNYCNSFCEIVHYAIYTYAKDGWLSIDSLLAKIRTFNDFAETYSLILAAECYNEMQLENTYTGKPIFLDSVIKNITHPFVKAYLFLMAAWGVVEIAYEEKPEEGDTCYYDTLRYVRLTDLGKYVFGITKKYERKAEKKKTYFELDDSNLIVKSLDDKNPYLWILDNVGTAISKRMYKVTYESFLNGCNKLADIINKEKLFKDYVCKNPPANWEHFFQDVKKRCNPLTTSKKKYTVMEIPTDNKELQRIILSDPVIRKYSVKAEGYLLLVETSNKSKVAEALKKYGYLL